MRRSLAVSCLLMLLSAIAAPASDLDSTPPPDLFAQAELIFEGEVIGVEYRTSDGSGGPPTPHTFVTYRIARIFSGTTTDSRSLTLRFIGGMGSDRRFLLLEGCPLFQIGDHDVLFVRGNGRSYCPLVQQERGRFRILDGKAFSAAGDPLYIDKDSRVVAPPGRRDERLATFRIAPRMTLRETDKGEHPAEQDLDLMKSLTRLDRRAFATFVADRVKRLDPGRQRAAVESVDPNKPFAMKPLMESPMRQYRKDAQ